MFDNITIYFCAGLIGGLVVFLFLFQKWDLPGLLKKKFHLNSQLKATMFLLVVGMIFALVVVFLTAYFSITKPVAQTMEGVAIGLNCAILTGVMRPKESAGKNNGTPGKSNGVNRRVPDNKGRRSKG